MYRDVLQHRAVALLIFFARTAGTRIVAADLGLIANDSLHLAGFFTGRGCALVWSGELHSPTASRGESATLNFFRRFFGDDLEVKERTNCRGIDAIEHRLKHI